MSSSSSEEEDSSCWLNYVALASGPTIAFVYAISVWITYATTHECTWGSKVSSLSLRLAFVVATVAAAIGLCQGQKTDHQGNNNLSTMLPIGAVLWVVSGYLMHCTRIYDVVGVAKPPFYGARHLHGKIVLITGANSGIGKETTTQLARMGATVYLLCRSEARAKQAVEDIIKKSNAGADTTTTVDASQFVVLPMDLGDLASIRTAVDLLTIDKVDILINNAGLMMGKHTKSKNDGLEMMMQANHLGHFLLTNLLLDKKLLTKEARILNVTSSTYALSTNGFDFDDIMCESTRPYTLFGQYSMTKLANILCTKELSRRLCLEEKNVFAIHPGIVRTNITSNMQWYLKVPNAMSAWFVATLQKTPSQGAYSSVYCAAAPIDQLPSSGSYITNCQAYPTTKFADSPEVRTEQNERNKGGVV
jgi:NAD(P)-dependent dehydrogenase (short-subunit alcohol dehydrogenase family)